MVKLKHHAPISIVSDNKYAKYIKRNSRKVNKRETCLESASVVAEPEHHLAKCTGNDSLCVHGGVVLYLVRWLARWLL